MASSTNFTVAEDPKQLGLNEERGPSRFGFLVFGPRVRVQLPVRGPTMGADNVGAYSGGLQWGPTVILPTDFGAGD